MELRKWYHYRDPPEMCSYLQHAMSAQENFINLTANCTSTQENVPSKAIAVIVPEGL